jgi:hypothetical protein
MITEDNVSCQNAYVAIVEAAGRYQRYGGSRWNPLLTRIVSEAQQKGVQGMLNLIPIKTNRHEPNMKILM